MQPHQIHRNRKRPLARRSLRQNALPSLPVRAIYFSVDMTLFVSAQIVPYQTR
jgi:hypothetical protein